MNKILILIGIFLVIVYVYLYIRIKKTKEKTKSINSVRDFNSTYKHLTGKPKQLQSDRYNQNNRYNNYVTKYNSSEDYREKR